MKKVAVFGNAGAGKSTLARRLAEVTGLPLYVIDLLQFRDGRYWPDEKNGGKLAPDEFASLHREILSRDRWILDGYGSLATTMERIAAADTLVHVDPPLLTLYAQVTKRFVQGLRQTPKGWPETSPLVASTLDSYRVVRLCHRDLTPRYREIVAKASATKRVHHLRSRAEIASFLQAVRQEYRM